MMDAESVPSPRLKQVATHLNVIFLQSTKHITNSRHRHTE